MFKGNWGNKNLFDFPKYSPEPQFVEDFSVVGRKMDINWPSLFVVLFVSDKSLAHIFKKCL